MSERLYYSADVCPMHLTMAMSTAFDKGFVQVLVDTESMYRALCAFCTNSSAFYVEGNVEENAG